MNDIYTFKKFSNNLHIAALHHDLLSLWPATYFIYYSNINNINFGIAQSYLSSIIVLVKI